MNNSDPRLSAATEHGLSTCPWCNQGVMFRKALWPSDGNVDAIIHAESTMCGMVEFSDGTTDESILTKWNARTFPDAQSVGMREALESARGEIVLAVAFLGRDLGTDRLNDTVDSLITRLAKADADARAALASQPSPAATVETTSHNLATGERDNEETDPTYFHSSAGNEDMDYILPCDVKLDPATIIRKGCKLSTLLSAFKVRESQSWPEVGGWVPASAASIHIPAPVTIDEPQTSGVWQPIETRPDKTEHVTYLVANDKGQVAPWIDGIIHNNVGTAWDWNYGESITAWMPLPSYSVSRPEGK